MSLLVVEVTVMLLVQIIVIVLVVFVTVVVITVVALIALVVRVISVHGVLWVSLPVVVILGPFVAAIMSIRLVVDSFLVVAFVVHGGVVSVIVVSILVVLISVVGLEWGMLWGNCINLMAVLFVKNRFLMVGSDVLALVMALEVVVLWSVGGESLVVSLVVVWFSVLTVLVRLDRLVVDGDLVGGRVVLVNVMHWLVMSGVFVVAVLVVNGLLMDVLVVPILLVVWLEVVELFLVDGNVVFVVAWDLVLPVLVVVV